MKILDRYILTTYLKTFLSVFVILMLIFVLQSIWLYIKELAGKDLDIVVILKFLLYVTPKLIPLVLPLTILLSSIMVFGSFAENYEFAAMKSTGISLQRAMAGLSVFIVGVGIVTFFFANNVIPWADRNFYNLRSNIAKSKPSMAIIEGQFNTIEDTPYNIKVEKKSGDRDQFLENVTIHVKGNNNKTNSTVITSKTGEFASEESSNVLKLILRDGNYYQDHSSTNRKSRKRKPFFKVAFETKIINIDLSEMNNVDFDEQSQTDKYNMLDVNGLNTTIDSLALKYNSEKETFAKNLHGRSGLTRKPLPNKKVRDTVFTGDALEIFDTKEQIRLVESALKSALSSKQLVIANEKKMSFSKNWLNRHVISLHEKFALGFACVILFFVGAPLGALIRKGGIGLPMVIAILLFLTYHFIGIFAINSAKSGDFNPVVAPWFSTLLMFPLGVFLTKRATADRGLFEFGNVLEPLKTVFKIKNKHAIDYSFLSDSNPEELVSIVNNYDTLGHQEDIRYFAVETLEQKGISTQELADHGIQISQKYQTSKTIKKGYDKHSKFALTLYIIGVVLLILFFVCKNNKFPALSLAAMQLRIVAFVLFIFFFIKSIISVFKFYKHIDKQQNKPNILLLILALPIYFMTYLLLKEKLKADLRLNCLESLK